MLRDFTRYTGMAFELVILLLIAIYAGRKLEVFFEMEKPFLQGIMALLAVSGYLALLIIKIQYKNKNDRKKDL